MGRTIGGKTVSNGLVLALDAANKLSYPGSGTSWIDLSGNNNTGTLTNGPTFSAANLGSIVFDGTNDYVVSTLNQTPTLDITSTITLETWIKATALVNVSNGAGLFSKGFSSDLNSGVYELGLSQSGGANIPFFRMRISSTTPIYNPSNILMSVNNIYHLVATYNGSIMRIFINGIESGSGNSTSGNIESNTQRLAIGVRYGTVFSGLGSSYLTGNMYINRIYNRALTATEVLQNYNANKSRFGL
jgi:hypothetical protein